MIFNLREIEMTYERISRTNHGESKSRFYSIYNAMRQRCNNPKCDAYKYYGAFGICCERLTYEDFKKDMYDSYLKHSEEYGEKDTTIDRINSFGNYCKKNCRWATKKEQNRTKSDVKKFEYNGKLLTAREIFDKEQPNVLYYTFRQRLKKGWSVERALLPMW